MFESFESCDTDDQKLVSESENQAIVDNPLTFHCGHCNAVWADSRGLCGEAPCVNSLICLKVTQDVTINEELESRREGPMAACSYNAMHCSGCRRFIGVVLYSTPPHLAALRSLFLLKKDNMYCYIFKIGQMVKASTLNFNTQRPLRERISELKQLIQEVECNLDNVSAVMDDSCMDDMTTSTFQ
ncbi:protein Mis18-beta [Esox lucius]|uniref:Opa interacting protein 5 n=1 Tax=Esox lucius TaxID=8010 RepID=A0AAY5K5P4_ESOLU|nr:protein Mis18-beta [Esox lucius]